MFPQRHSIIGGDVLEQMLQLQSSAPPMPLPTPMDNRSSSRSSWKPNIEVAPNCPRCSSTNTKFCYYNNYSLSQPRYFCKGCRRYWTKGGSLRNVPVGGGCRKNRRGKSLRHSPQGEHHSLNNVNSGCDDRESSSLETNNGCGSDIDLALVFAKFLNQNPSSGHEEFESEGNNNGSSSCSNNASTTSLTPESVEAENDAVMQPQKKPPHDPIDGDAMLIGEVSRDENFVGEELGFSGIDELDGFLGEDVVVQDHALWSYDDATMSSSVNNNSWQPPMTQMQLQELEHSMMPLNEDADQILLPISSTSTINLLSDSWSTWSSFDLQTMEVFTSTP